MASALSALATRAVTLCMLIHEIAATTMINTVSTPKLEASLKPIFMFFSIC